MNDRASSVDVLTESITNDLANLYKVFDAEFRDSFYRFILSSNPKFYPISGFQHFLGAGFVATRLAQYLGFSDYDVLVAFLGSVFHDFNKWHVSVEEVKKHVYERFAYTKLYESIRELLGDEKKVEQAFLDATEIGLKLESGGIPRNLQGVAELVRIADILTGSKESWSLSYCINNLISLAGIDVKNVLPVFIGKQRPLLSIVSELVEEKLEELGATPLISTPEGMLFLAKEQVNATEVYKFIAEQISSVTPSTLADRPKSDGKGRKTRTISINSMRNFLQTPSKKLAPLAKIYKKINGYTPEEVERSYEKHQSVPDDLCVYVVVLAYIYMRDPDGREDNIVRLRRFIEALGLPRDRVVNVMSEHSAEGALRAFYRVLQSLRADELRSIAENAKHFILNEMAKYREIDMTPLVNKLHSYISIGFSPYEKQLIELANNVRICGVCREPVVFERKLPSFLQELSTNIKPKINVSEVFHPDAQGSPEKSESITKAKELPVCETCYFETMVAPKRIGYVDGLWAVVLQYYPAIPTDLIKVVKYVVKEFRKEGVVVIPDYMTSRVIVSEGKHVLDAAFLRTALDVWFLLGGNLVVTTTALSTAFVGTSVPIELEVTDVVIEEAVAEYMRMLERARRDEGYIRFTREMRYWLYKTLRDYVSKLEPKKGLTKTPSIQFSRSGLQATGFATIDVYSFVLKQLEKTEGGS